MAYIFFFPGNCKLRICIKPSFTATLIASNPCGSTPITLSAIYISQKPISKFTASDTTACVSKQITFTNTSPITNNVSNGNCAQSKNYWKITPSIGWSIISGSLGSSRGFTDPFAWTVGTNVVNVNFTSAGIYKVIQYLGNPNCGFDSSVRTICINPQPIANFSTNLDSICVGGTVNFTNLSNLPSCNNYLKMLLQNSYL